MSKSLVIVESPAKAKTINKYLGKEFIVKSSVGHIRDLPTSGGSGASDPAERAKAAAITRKMSGEEKIAHKRRKAHDQLIARMGVDPEHGWKARYEILPGKEKVVAELKKLARDADTIYLATDLDREGEAIAWHLKESIGGDEKRFKRVVFNEITRKAINEAFSRPGDLDMKYVEAQQARRFLDRVVGFMVSPLLWAKVARGLSAGRVQSVAVRLIVEREREIRAFVPEEYWELFADVTTRQKAALRLQAVDMQSLVEETRAMLDATAAIDAPGHRIDWHIGPMPVLVADENMLRQVWGNLLGNAVKYSANSEPAVIDVAHRQADDGEHVFTITDNGAGFDMAYAGKLFGVFQRLHAPSEFSGTGIGLASVKRVLTRHNGRIWAESEPGKGATFHFTLPANLDLNPRSHDA